MKTVLLSEVIDDIKTGDLLAFGVRRYSTITSFVLKLYQKLTKSHYSHVGIALRVGDRIFMVEATPPRVCITPLYKLEDFHLIPANIKTSNEKATEWLLSKVGDKYNLIDMFTHYLGLDFNENRVYCSELAAAFYKHVGYLTSKDYGHTPDKIVKACLAKACMKEPINVVFDRGNLR